MRARAGIVAALAAAALAACGGGQARPLPNEAAAAPRNWRAVVTREDRDRLRRWREAWSAALSQVSPAQVAAYGALLEPDRALPRPLPPAGAYRCRTIKLGAQAAGMPVFTAYPWFACRIADEGGGLSFAKEDGSQRPVGRIFDDGGARAVFLGTLMLGDERAALPYGQDRTRDMAGFVERVGDRRWRLALPHPAFESLMDVIELVPSQ